MTVLKRHIGRQVAAIGAGVALLVLGLATPAYAAIPTVTSVTPSTNAVAGCEVTIIGTNFQTNGGPATNVSFGGTSLGGSTEIVSIDSNTQLEATIPAATAAGSNPILVTNGDGDNTPAFAYTTLAAAAVCPGVPTFSPASGIVGSTVTISGTFNSIVTGVRFNTSTLVTPTNPSTTGATAVVPAGATSGPIHVYTAAGQKTSATSFTVTPVPAPTITSFTPTFGPVGTSVTITGTNFSGTISGANFTTSVVKFNTTNATSFTVNSATQITATVPTGATTGKISVTTPGGTATSVANFTVSIPHSRTVTLTLKKHIVAKGAVNVGDAFTACEAGVPVKIQRKTSGGWKNVGSATTTSTGSYSKKIKDKTGKYRAQVKKFTPNAGVDVCSKATSPVRKHTHH
jgi:hypothetical protein